MITYYKITDTGIKTSDAGDSDWVVLEKASPEERNQIVTHYDLPKDIFVGGDDAEEISHLENLKNGRLGAITILSLMNLCADRQLTIEERLEPLIFVIAPETTITFVGDNSDFIPDFIQQYGGEVTSKERLCGLIIQATYTHYLQELKALKAVIDQLDRAARTTTKNEELFRLADTQRHIVYLDNTLQGQKETLDYLWQETDFPDRLGDENLVYNIRLRQAHAEERILIYRDLLDTIGGLFSDMMSNHLNHLMKYLDSAALVISMPTLVAGIWGMNTAGLPGRENKLGFMLVMGLAALVTLLAALHLKYKDFTK